MRTFEFRKIVRGGVLSALLVLLAATSGWAAAATEKAVAQETLRRFLKCWETGDRETFAALLHPRLVFGYPGGRLTRDGLIQTFDTYQTQKKEIKIYFGDLSVSDGKHYIANYQFAATDRVTGKRFAVGTGAICELSEGKIVALREYWDAGVSEQQKEGLLPLDEGKVSPWPMSVWLRPEEIN